MKRLLQWWRDVRRGYSDSDMEAVIGKLSNPYAKPGTLVLVTQRELRASCAINAANRPMR